MAKENENLESTEETVEEVVADKDAEQEHLDRQKEEEESIALASEKAKEKAKRAKTKKTRDAGKPSSGGRFLGGLALVAVSALVGAGAMYVSLGNKTTEETTLVSMKGDTVTVGDVFDSLKGSSQTQQSVLSATLQKALEKEYGSKVSKEDVDKAYKQASEQYGDQFSQVLAAYGQTEESYRNQIRTQKLVEYAVNQAAQKDLTEANYKAAYDNYTPNTEVQVVSTTDKAVADKVDSEAKAVAKDNSLEVTSKTVNSASQDFPADVLTAAFKQDANAVSDVVTVSNSSTGAATYYIVKTVSKSEKNADWKNYKDDLTKVIINGKKSDTNFTNSVIAKVLKKYNVKVVDKAFSAILDQYVTGSGASASASSSASKEITR